ncbi:LexA family transcriptional regulator [Ornithobacterium rhinotracheale]|uniref:LexA family transcriptional regulator n=1 Tax=Ornithobacterium rhinotracheale TaxID=28251 RepID=UPI001FF68689|nr:helix-turn-helix domain-containing protein [Ornithobacterium rhinotracheale]MCK0203733.1 helix-turn-helix domain-containing protein [Ornithobacterium rhinotracheale]
MDKTLIINEIKSHLNIKTDSDLADFLGVKQPTISTWRKRNSIDYDLIMTKCNNINGHWLLTGEGEMLKTEREVPEVSAKYSGKGIPLLPFDAFAGSGSDIEGINFDIIEERYEVPLFNGIKVDFLIPVKGSSMYPKYSSGDVVACRFVEELLFVQWNKVHVIDTISQGVIMKRLKKGSKNECLTCISDNPNYDPFEIPMSDVRKIALVVGVIRLE